MKATEENENKNDSAEADKSAKVMGDIVENKSSTDNLNDQMRNELEVLRLEEKSTPTPMLGIEEVDSTASPQTSETILYEGTLDVKIDDNLGQPSGEEPVVPVIRTTTEIELINPVSNEGDTKQEISTDSKDEGKSKNEEVTKEQSSTPEESSKGMENSNAPNSALVTESPQEQNDQTNLNVTEAPETGRSDEAVDTEPVTCVEYLKPISNDIPSSDLSDTDTTDKAEKASTESGVDETSRDERDEMSEIENFDLSSCGEDSLEAMYYMIRKNEIIMDRHKQDGDNTGDEDKMTFPDKATDDLEHAVREVSGKKIKLCSIGSMNSSMDDVVLKKLSSDSDELQLHVIPNSEIDSSSSDLRSCPLKEQCTANESTDDEYMNPILDSMRKNDEYLNEMHAKALSVQPNRSSSQSDEQQEHQQQQLETDTFNEHLMDDMMPGNIERKILASSVSEADSDYFELPPTQSRLTKDDFNVSTAFEHMIRADSTTEDSDSTIESAATKIQAGARGFLARRRIRRSSAGTSASNEMRSSIGNAAIDKSLDNLIEQQELQEENAYSESFDDESLPRSHELLYDETIDSVDSEKVLGITEVKVEQRKDDDANAAGNEHDDNNANDEKVPGINIQGTSEESVTAQRRLMLQRNDAMQRNDTPESSEHQQQQQQQPQQQQSDDEKSNNGENRPPNEKNNEKVDTATKTSKFAPLKFINAIIQFHFNAILFLQLPSRTKKH